MAWGATKKNHTYESFKAACDRAVSHSHEFNYDFLILDDAYSTLINYFLVTDSIDARGDWE